MAKCLNFLSLNGLIWKVGLINSSQSSLIQPSLIQIFPCILSVLSAKRMAHRMLFAMLTHFSSHL